MNPRIISVVAILMATTLARANDAQVVITPQETDEILANPGMGWETFGRTSNPRSSIMKRGAS